MNQRENIGRVDISVKLRRALWCMARALLFRPFGTKVFRLWRIAVLHCFGAQTDWTAEVYASAEVWAPWQLTMAAHSCIGPHVIVYNQARVTLHERACLSQHAYVCTAGHEPGVVNNAATGLVVAPVTLGAEAWVGARAFIGMGVVVGQGAVVGACACVFKDVAPKTVVGGNPAQLIRRIE